MLALMPEGRFNGAIAGILVVSERSVEKYVVNVFSKPGPGLSDADHPPGCWPSSATWRPDRRHRRR